MGSLFHCDNPLIVMLNKVGNMMLVSLFWLIACVPLVTIVPASAALYHTTAKVIRGSGNGVAADFFSALRENLKQGTVLSLLAAGAWFVLYTCLDFGWQLRRSAFGTAYFAVAALLCLLAAGVCMFLAPVLSRFAGRVPQLLRLAAYLALRHPLRALWRLALLAAVAFGCWFYPVLLLLLPGMYTDLTCGSVEKALARYLAEKGPAETEQAPESAPPPALELPTALEQAAAWDKG